MRWMFGLDDLYVFNVLYVLGDLDVLTHIIQQICESKNGLT